MNAPRESTHGRNTSGFKNLTYVTALAIIGLVWAKFGLPDKSGQNGFRILGNLPKSGEVGANTVPLSKGQQNLVDFAQSAGN